MLNFLVLTVALSSGSMFNGCNDFMDNFSSSRMMRDYNMMNNDSYENMMGNYDYIRMMDDEDYQEMMNDDNYGNMMSDDNYGNMMSDDNYNNMMGNYGMMSRGE